MASDATQTEDGGYLTWEERFGGLLSTRQSRTILVRRWIELLLFSVDRSIECFEC